MPQQISWLESELALFVLWKTGQDQVLAGFNYLHQPISCSSCLISDENNTTTFFLFFFFLLTMLECKCSEAPIIHLSLPFTYRKGNTNTFSYAVDIQQIRIYIFDSSFSISNTYLIPGASQMLANLAVRYPKYQSSPNNRHWHQ